MRKGEGSDIDIITIGLMGRTQSQYRGNKIRVACMFNIYWIIYFYLLL